MALSWKWCFEKGEYKLECEKVQVFHLLKKKKDIGCHSYFAFQSEKNTEVKNKVQLDFSFFVRPAALNRKAANSHFGEVKSLPKKNHIKWTNPSLIQWTVQHYIRWKASPILIKMEAESVSADAKCSAGVTLSSAHCLWSYACDSTRASVTASDSINYTPAFSQKTCQCNSTADVSPRFTFQGQIVLFFHHFLPALVTSAATGCCYLIDCTLKRSELK